SMGWPLLAFLAGLLIYFQVSVQDPERKKNLSFKTFIGMIAAVMVFIAIANYKMNFFGNSRLLPVSLAMITALAFMLALYFSKVSALMKIGGNMFFVAAALSGYGNWLPQVEGGFPPPEVKLDFSGMSTQQLADEGEKIIFGGLGQSKVQGAIGKGQCPLCHGFQQGFLSERAPNLFDIPERAQKRLEDPRYAKGNAEARDTTQKESFPGAGTAETVQEYIAESHACPSCYVVEGFGVKGSNDRESPMPAIHKPPISLTLGELAAVDTWLYVREGKEAPSYDEIVAAYEKFIPEGDRPQAAAEDDKKDGGGGGLLADGSEPLDKIFAKAQCVVCHTIPGIPAAMGTVGPKLVEGTNAPKRIKLPDYKGGAKTAREYITESILSPSAYVVKPFPDNVMPKIFGQKLSAGAVNKIVDYLVQVEEGKEPPPLQ
ncbi:MAG: nitric oxide reductase, partial [Nitrospirales bacterium]